jgi:hypothetical protein
VRSQLEQSAVVWHLSLTEENISDLERVQKLAVKIILGQKYQNYEKLGIETLEERKKNLMYQIFKKVLQ